MDSDKLKPWILPAISALMLAAGMILSHTGLLQENTITILIYYIVAFLPVGLPVLKEAFEGMRNGDFFSEFTLMSVASIGALAIGEYPEAVAVMLLYTIGEALQDGAVDKATRNIGKLVDVRPESATIVGEDGSTSEVAPKDVRVGNTIEVKAGGRIPLDGTLSDGEAEFDTSALTGESAPRTIANGGEVLAGMIVIGRPVRIKVSKPYEKSTLARILNLVQEASDRKAPAELFMRKFARIYTPSVMLLALLIVVLPAIAGAVSSFEYHFSEWLYRGLVFLVISCPCALVISIPLGYYAGIGSASKKGILFKGGNYLDALTRIDSIAFDKTGTLTKGRFEVTEVIMADDSPVDRASLLSLVMSAESKSTHPIARAIVEYTSVQNIEEASLGSLQEIAGHGIKAIHNGRVILVGNFRLMAKENVSIPQSLGSKVATVVLCAVDNIFAGAFLLEDCLKDDARAAMNSLRELGITDIHLLSGDKKEIVAKYADELGIAPENSHAELLPEDKATRISDLMGKSSRKVAFVGDGMNDAPVLAMSNVGIAMGGIGSDAAVESADIVIQNDMPSRMATAVRIARSTKLVVRENITGAISVKLIVLVTGAMGITSLWCAVFADVGVALLAVGNSMRLLYKKYN